jgi:hypothetical protein
VIGIKQFVTVVIGIGLTWGLGGVAAYANLCPSLLNSAKYLNTSGQGKVIILGQLSGRHYVVLVPGDRERDFQSIQQCVPDAFISVNRLGKYIHVGSFLDYMIAKRWEKFLRSRKLDARVVFLREGQI